MDLIFSLVWLLLLSHWLCLQTLDLAFLKTALMEKNVELWVEPHLCYEFEPVKNGETVSATQQIVLLSLFQSLRIQNSLLHVYLFL